MKKIIESSGSEEDIIVFLNNIDIKDKEESELINIVNLLYEHSKYNACIHFINLSLDYFKNNYYEVVFILTKCLIEIKDFKRAGEILKEELSMPYIPYKYEELFISLVAEINANTNEKTKPSTLTKEEITSILLLSDNYDSILQVIIELDSLNTRNYLSEIAEFFLRGNIKNFFKVMLVDVLRKQMVNHEFKYDNNGNIYKINPIASSDLLTTSSYLEVETLLRENLAIKHPDIYEVARQLLVLYLSYKWPLTLEEDEHSKIAHAIHYYLKDLYSLDLSDVALEEIYGNETSQIKGFITCIEKAGSL